MKSIFKINQHALYAAGVLGLFIPIFKGIQSNLWFWKSFSMGYPDSFLVDVSWIWMSVITLLAAWKAKPIEKKRKVKDEVEEDGLESVSEKVLSWQVCT
ncbi:MAG: hypothetical protein AAGI25_13380 [Bacteroidota bacterium]